MQQQSEHSLPELLGMLTQDIVTLIRQEMVLAKAELSQKASRIGRNVGMLATAGLIGYIGVLAIVVAVILILAQRMPLWASALVVGAIFAAVGGILASKAITALKSENLVPQQTLQTLQEFKNG